MNRAALLILVLMAGCQRPAPDAPTVRPPVTPALPPPVPANTKPTNQYVGWTYAQLVKELGPPTRTEMDLTFPAVNPGDKPITVQQVIYEDALTIRSFELMDGKVASGTAIRK